MTTHLFDDVAAIYDETLPAHVVQHYEDRRVAFLESVRGSGPVLDVGAGTGRLAARCLAAAPFPTVGVDYSRPMLMQAPPSVRGVQASAGALPFPDRTFGLVYTVAMLHHLHDPALCRSAVAEMWRVTARGGTLVIWDHNPLNPYWPMLMRRMPQDQEPTRLVPRGEILEILRRAGAQNIETQRCGWIPEFCPPRLLTAASRIERLLERIPGVVELSAHNVVVARRA